LLDQQQAGALDLKFRLWRTLQALRIRAAKLRQWAIRTLFLLERLRLSAALQMRGFSVPEVAIRSLRGGPPLLYEAHRRNIASI